MNDQDDTLTRFLLARSGVRGAIVRLTESWEQICHRGEYPHALVSWLGETAAAAALLTAHVKVSGRLSVQIKSSSNLRTLFADCSQTGVLRGIALFDEPLPEPLRLDRLGDGTIMAITIERAPSPNDPVQRYQGLVDVRVPDLSSAIEGYFAQSEQLPTRLLLAARAGHAAGLLIQQLPGTQGDPDGWTRAQALFDTLGQDELLGTEPNLILHRLFHEESVELLSRHDLAFGCSCSRQRVGDVLLALGVDQATASIEESTGVVGVQCEFCGQRYSFDAVDLQQLFAGGGTERASPKQLN